MMTIIQERLFTLQDKKYREFNASLCPTVDAENMIGVRTPQLKSLAKELIKEGNADEFLTQLPHQYFEENQLHAFILSELKDYERIIRELYVFLPYVDNWATCDQLRPKVFKKHTDELIHEIRQWIVSEDTYMIRFAIGMLMCHYLDENFQMEYLEMVSRIHSEEYYVNMMSTWYFATALAKKYDMVIPYLEKQKLDAWVHNKTIQKARESFRITSEQKEYLKKLKL